MAAIVTGEEAIRHVQRLAQLSAMRLELKGMRHSSGRSMIVAIKRHYGLKGNKQAVVDQFAQIVEKMKPQPVWQQGRDFKLPDAE